MVVHQSQADQVLKFTEEVWELLQKDVSVHMRCSVSGFG
jgi:hypothetical protein